MKKLAILVGAIALTGSTFAQKATLDNPWSLEGGINYNSGTGIDWNAPTIRARYFVNENIAARVQLGIGDGLGTPMKESYTVYDGDSLNGATGTAEIKRMNWVAQIGAEYHLAGTDRMSPYFALGINFGGGSQKQTTSDAMPKITPTDIDAAASTYGKGVNYTDEGKMSMFGVSVGAGMDFYVFENIYLGVELGLGFSSYNYKDYTGTLTTTTPATTTEVFSPGSKESHLSTGAANAAFRLGWRF
ncbi:MAG: hypothetical protein RLZ33_2867 [Bacteroidota bacterium]|jgi:opacity protein-like surface antigen